LRRRFPMVRIVQGDASNLSAYLPKDEQVDCIVSSLPLISLKEHTRTALIKEMYTSLDDGGMLIQYTYSWRDSNRFLKNTFRFMDSRKVWNNVPPARVFRFVRQYTQ
ncbi:MAG: methyltransferase, partial [Bilophila sp.]